MVSILKVSFTTGCGTQSDIEIQSLRLGALAATSSHARDTPDPAPHSS